MTIHITQHNERHSVTFFDDHGRPGKGGTFSDPVQANDFVKRTIDKDCKSFQEFTRGTIFASCIRFWSDTETDIEYLRENDYLVTCYANRRGERFYRVHKTESNYVTFTEVAFNYYFKKI